MKSAIRRPQITQTLTLGGLLVSACLYALALCTKPGKRWATEQTWATVVAGVALVAGWLALEDRAAAKRAMVYFSVAGVPIITRSLWLQLQRIDAVIDRAMS